MKLCDLTQFYSPFSGGVKRYVSEKVRFIRERGAGDEHILIIPGERDECTGDATARIYTIASPLISKTSRYRVLLRLEAIERILEKERPDLIESGDPYQVAWKAVHSGAALGIPVVGFYHSHFAEAYVRTVQKFCGRTITEAFMDFARRYVRNLYARFERTIVPSPALGDVLVEWGVPEEKIFHSDLGVDTSVFHPEPGLEVQLGDVHAIEVVPAVERTIVRHHRGPRPRVGHGDGKAPRRTHILSEVVLLPPLRVLQPELLAHLGRLQPRIDEDAVRVRQRDEPFIVVRVLRIRVPSGHMDAPDALLHPELDEVFGALRMPEAGIEIHFERLPAHQRGHIEEGADVLHHEGIVTVPELGMRIEAGPDEEHLAPAEFPADDERCFRLVVDAEHFIAVAHLEFCEHLR